MEENNNIPDGWISEDFGNLIVEKKKSNLKVSDATNFGSFPFFTSGEAILLHNEKQIDGENIFLATGGVANVKYFNGEVAYSTDTYAITSNEKIDTKFLFYYSQNIINYINLNYFQGSGLKHLQKKDFKKHKVDFPKTVKEQSKIAEILSKVDNAISETEVIIRKYNRIKTGLMQDLLTKGINRDCKKFVQTDLKNLKVNSDFNITKLKSITKVRQGYQIEISLRKKEEGENRFVYITVQYLNNPIKYLEYIENPPLEVISKYDDILFTRTGNTGQIVTNIIGVYHNNFFKVDFDKELITKDYLLLFLGWKPVQDLILELAGTTTIPDLKHRDFYSIPIFFPKDLKEQNEITKIISSSDCVINDYTIELNKLKSIKTGLMQDLLSGKKRVTHLIN
jgi:type I restriction enzyme, S subunit